ncbi:response regulator [Oceanobacillus sp. CAU 1775]
MRKKVLIIDDSEDILYTLKEIGEYAGYSCSTALNGKDGLQLFLVEEPDLILLDFHMPVMDGLVLLKTIRQMDQDTPIIILTVDGSQEIADKFLDEGASDFALKPIKAPDIISRIQVHLKMAALIEQQSKLLSETNPRRISTDLSAFLIKGIAKGTLQIITDYLRGKNQSIPLEKISEETGISYPTVHRYLNHLVQEKAVEIETTYGNVGRPKNYYRWKEEQNTHH